MKTASAEAQKSFLLEISNNVASFDRNLQEFVLGCLDIKWKLGESDDLRNVYRNFLVSLVTAHLDYCIPVLQHLFQLLTIGKLLAEAMSFISYHTLKCILLTL